MHASTDIRKVKCLDALSMSYSLLEYNYSHLYDKCAAIQESENNLSAALSYAWMIIDLVHRIREISQGIPGLSKRNKYLSRFLQETKVAEEYRHYIQHLRGELSKNPPNPFPVWGSLCWIDMNDSLLSHLAIFGAQLEGNRLGGAIYDREEKRWLSRVTLSIGDLTFSFDPIVEETLAFRDFILPWLINSYQPGVKVTNNVSFVSISASSLSS
jgi:hypothetical protein